MSRSIGVVLVATVAASMGGGCSAAACDTSDQPAERYEAGTTVNGVYYSSSAHGDLLPFPGAKRYDIVHHLGFEPIIVQLYWSFHEGGIGYDEQTLDKGSLSLAAGNSALMQLKNDEYIRVKNDSCADFYLLVTASGDPRTDAGEPTGTADAGSD